MLGAIVLTWIVAVSLIVVGVVVVLLVLVEAAHHPTGMSRFHSVGIAGVTAAALGIVLAVLLLI